MTPDLNLQKSLDADQLAAVLSGSKRLLCMANAGSGKTRMLTYRAANFIANGTRPENILMLTFTKKAANEMRTRIDGLLRGTNTGLTAGTFHGIACMCVREYPYAAKIPQPFSIFDSDDTLKHFRNALKAALEDDPGLKTRVDPFPTAKDVMSWYSYARNTGQDFREYLSRSHGNLYQDERDALVDLCGYAVRYYENVKRSTPALDFDDMLVRFAEMLEDPRFLAMMHDRFHALFVDEYQDINILQHRIVTRLAHPNGYLTAVGDDAQCIYGFRGSEVDFIRNFRNDFENPEIAFMAKNYRSAAPIVNFAARVLNDNIGQDLEPKIMLPVRAEPAPDPKCLLFRNEYDQARYIARECAAAKSRMGWSDMAVLVRANQDAAVIERALLKARIPVSVESGIGFYQRRQVRLAVKFLQFLRVPSDETAFSAVMESCPGIGAKTSARLFAAFRDAGYKPDALGSAKLPPKHAAGLARTALDRMAESLGLLDSGITEPRQLASGFILDFLHPYCELAYGDDKKQLGKRLEELESLVEQLDGYDSLNAFLEDANLSSEPVPSGTGRDEVLITTIHRSKGLEFRKVFLPNMTDGIIPCSRQFNKPKELEEEARVLYVAMTRAMDELDVLATMTCRRFTENGGPRRLYPSRFLDGMDFAMAPEIPEDPPFWNT